MFEGKKGYSIAKAGSSNAVEIALDGAKTPGYYTLRVIFDDAKSGCSLLHNAAFAIMPRAGRKVSKWFALCRVVVPGHGSPGTPEIGGPIMQKAGIVRASANNQLKDEHYEKYNLTNYRITYMDPAVDRKTGEFKPVTVTSPDPDDPEGKKTIKKEYPVEEGTAINLRRTLEKNPRIDTVMLWHESAPGYGIPEELLGKPVPQEKIEADKMLAVKVDLCGRIVRRVNKELGRDVKLQIGNSSASIGAVVRPLRAGARADSYHLIGIETPSQVIPPERLIEVGLQGMVVSKDIGAYYAKKQGVRAPGLNGCWEFTYRCERDMGERQQAEWYVRDVLISLANDFYYISPGILFDCKNGYYNGLWGGSGLIRRAPFCYPKQAYVAYGVLTSVLDGVKFVRQLDTGSTTVYALEFKRATASLPMHSGPPAARRPSRSTARQAASRPTCWVRPRTSARARPSSTAAPRRPTSSWTSPSTASASRAAPSRRIRPSPHAHRPPGPSTRPTRSRWSPTSPSPPATHTLSRSCRPLTSRWRRSPTRRRATASRWHSTPPRTPTPASTSPSTPRCVSRSPSPSPATHRLSVSGSRATPTGGRSASRSRTPGARSSRTRRPAPRGVATSWTGPATWP